MFYQLSRQSNFSTNLLSAHRGERKRRRFLVAREIGFHKTVFGLQWRMLADVVTNRLRGDGHHVLAGRIASGEFEQKIDVVALYRYSNVRQFTVRGSLSGSSPQLVAMLDAPHREQPCAYK